MPSTYYTELVVQTMRDVERSTIKLAQLKDQRAELEAERNQPVDPDAPNYPITEEIALINTRITQTYLRLRRLKRRLKFRIQREEAYLTDTTACDSTTDL